MKPRRLYHGRTLRSQAVPLDRWGWAVSLALWGLVLAAKILIDMASTVDIP